MKQILLLALIVCSLQGFSQRTYQYLGTSPTTVYNRGELSVDSGFYLPRYFSSRFSKLRDGGIRYGDSTIKLWDGLAEVPMIRGQYTAKQIANIWLDSVRVENLNLTKRITGDLEISEVHIENNTKVTPRYNGSWGIYNRGKNDPYRPAGWYSSNGSASAYTGPFGETMMGWQKYLYEAAGDTGDARYGSLISGTSRYTMRYNDSATYDSLKNKTLALPMSGPYFVGQVFPSRNAKVRTSAFGHSGSVYTGVLGFGGPDSTWKIRLVPDPIAPIPWAVYNSEIDFDRETPSNKKREITGDWMAGFTAHWKGYQPGLGAWSGSPGSRIGRYACFYANQSLYTNPYGNTATKAQILAHSRIDTAVGVAIPPQWTELNEVNDGYGIAQWGEYDVNHLAGRTFFGYPWWKTKVGADSLGANVIASSYKLFEYGRNLGSLYTTRSLVDKGYVDSTVAAASGGSPATVQNLTDGATITWDVASGYNATVTIAGNRTLAISNAQSGQYGTIKVIQDATGSRTITLPAGSKVVSGGFGAVTLSTAAGTIDILTFFYDGTNYFWTIGKNFN